MKFVVNSRKGNDARRIIFTDMSSSQSPWYNIRVIGDLYFTSAKPMPPKTLGESVQEICIKTEPKPLYCELPDDLKLKSITASGTTQAYTYTSSMVSLSSLGTTSTTTTL